MQEIYVQCAYIDMKGYVFGIESKENKYARTYT